MKKFTTILLLCSMLVSLAACGGDASGGDADTSADTSTLAVETDETSGREAVKDSLPADLDFGGQVIRIAYSDGLNQYFDEMQGAEQNGDIVNDAVYFRNLKVQDRLNVTFKFDAYSGGTSAVAGALQRVITAGEDAWDFIDNGQWGTMPLALSGLFHNLDGAPYLDYSKPWWTEDYMNKIQLSENSRYVLRGALSLQTLFYLSASYVNVRLYEDDFGDIDAFYEMVMDGQWTLDKMGQYSAQIYNDLNNNGEADNDDMLGFAIYSIGNVDHLSYPAGIQYFERGEDGYPQLISDQSRNVSVTEALYKLLYETEGVYMALTNKDGGAFVNGNALFHPGLLGNTGDFRDMKDEYGIIPTAKLDETQETYLSLVHDSASVLAIPITLPEIDTACAVLEALCAESYRSVVPAYYEVVLKVKYTRDNISAQFIDMIYENATTDFIYANNYVLSAGGSLGTLTRTLMNNQSKNYMSEYESIRTTVEASIDQLIEKVK